MRFHRSLSFKLTAFYVLLFVISVSLLFAVVGYLAQAAVEKQIRITVKAEAETLAAEYKATGPLTSAALIESRLRRGGSAYYLLQSSSGTAIAGNVTSINPKTGPSQLELTLVPDVHAKSAAQPSENRRAVGYGVKMPDGVFVLAAENVDWLDTVASAIRNAFIAAGLASTVLAILGGTLLSRGFLKRIDAINRTASQIMAGSITARIPHRARGDEIDDLAANLNLMLSRIETLMDNLSQVSNDIAHDLRTPLSRLRQRLEASRANAVTVEELRSETDTAIAETDDLLQTFSALLRIANIETGKRKAGFKKVDLSELVEFVSATYAAVAEDHEHRLASDIVPGVIIDGDRELLLQLVTNLIENAINHTPAGSTIRIALQCSDQDVSLSVADDGPGIPESERQKVLRRFYRLETSRTTAGSGLGLALVGAIAELHRARLTLADNEPGLIVRLVLRRA
ncbi:MAG: HAMP domain-containing sensor histidine kinase [Hyphomicrobiaceae bacterium]